MRRASTSLTVQTSVSRPSTPSTESSQSRQSSSPVSNSSSTVQQRSQPPYRVIKICPVCWKKRRVSQKKGSQCREGHIWKDSESPCLMLPCKLTVRPLPKKYPQDLGFTICWSIINKKRCDFVGCSYAHTKEEIEMWKWMARNKGQLNGYSNTM